MHPTAVAPTTALPPTARRRPRFMVLLRPDGRRQRATRDGRLLGVAEAGPPAAALSSSVRYVRCFLKSLDRRLNFWHFLALYSTIIDIFSSPSHFLCLSLPSPFLFLPHPISLSLSLRLFPSMMTTGKRSDSYRKALLVWHGFPPPTISCPYVSQLSRRLYSRSVGRGVLLRLSGCPCSYYS